MYKIFQNPIVTVTDKSVKLYDYQQGANSMKLIVKIYLQHILSWQFKIQDTHTLFFTTWVHN